MKDFEIIKTNYQKLRSALIKYLDRFEGESYFYQPTDKSNATAWIVPHIVAFEKVMVTDKIEGYSFDNFISEEDVEKYRPGVDGFAFTKDEMLTKAEVIKLLDDVQKISIKFLDALIKNDPSVSKVDRDVAFDKYMLNFSHETEHYGQMKYLLGTFNRTR
ncbi:MAG: DinB family protein [Asgard group archaeon]|nr:DinB family protein [Asgard group archaeon]